jgi:hypothetical protein
MGSFVASRFVLHYPSSSSKNASGGCCCCRSGTSEHLTNPSNDSSRARVAWGRGVELLDTAGTIRGIPTLEAVLEIPHNIANPLALEICNPHIFEIRQRELGK